MSRFFKENRSFILFIFLMLFFRSAVADWYHVPSASMKPNLIEGDRIWVNKLAYDVKIPMTDIAIYHRAEPKKGDVVVFNSKVAKNRLVKRVVGVAGDQVAMSNNRLIVNGELLAYQLSEVQEAVTDNSIKLFEQGTNYGYPIQLKKQPTRQSSFNTVTVPKDHLLVLGDNRDNSSDSRFIGFIPRNEIIGQSTHVVMSLNPDQYYLPRLNRFIEAL